MFRNYIKIALRNLWRQKNFSLINIIGLSTGLAVSTLILLFIIHEFSYDKFHEKSDRTYRITREWLDNKGETTFHLARIAPPILTHLRNDYNHLFENSVRILQDYSVVFKVNESTFTEDGLYWVEDEFFDVFSFNLIEGDPGSVFSEPKTVVLTERAAKKYFGNEDPIGRTLHYVGHAVLKVTGIVENPPVNSHFQFDMLGSMKTIIPILGEDTFTRNWGSNNYVTYVTLAPNVSQNQLEEVFPELIDKYYTPLYNQYAPVPATEPLSNTNKLHLQKITDIHLHSELGTELEANGSIETVYIFIAIGIGVLLIACINFMNLATARSIRRAKEVGMRKVLGAGKKQLIQQFLGESFIITMIAALLSVGIVYFSIPVFNEISQRALEFSALLDPSIILGFLLIITFVSLFAGSYPAFFLSAFKPLKVLRGTERSSGGSGALVKKALVTAQFAVTVVLIIAVLVVNNQLEYIQDKDLGIDKENVIDLKANDEMVESMDAIKSELMSHPDITDVSFSLFVPSDNLLNSYGGTRLDTDPPQSLSFRLAAADIDYDFFDTYDIDIVAGRKFSKEYAEDDSLSFIFNEAAVRAMGWSSPEEAIGKPFNYGGNDGRIIGVAEDVYFESLHNTISPTCYLISTNLNDVSIRTAGGNIDETLEFLRGVWAKWRPDYPFRFSFIDEDYESLYREEARLMDTFGIFSFLAIFIASIGLLGLTALATEQRKKEIGIRKTLGATVVNIVTLFFKDFVLLLIAANIIAWPIAYLLMNDWLTNFAYSTDISVPTFVIAAVLVLLISFATISYQTIKASNMNPVSSLREE